jgi:hypothetical protein
MNRTSIFELRERLARIEASLAHAMGLRSREPARIRALTAEAALVRERLWAERAERARQLRSGHPD